LLVDVVDDGALAVESVFSNSYDLVFMDCQMPEVDGYGSEYDPAGGILAGRMVIGYPS
jgi:AmiR/NasT family two-component response regulator